MSLSRTRKPQTPSRVGPAGDFGSLFWRLPHSCGMATPGQLFKVFISCLFCGGGPSAVVRRIRAVVVDAVKRMAAGRAASHVGQKRLKRVTPPIAYANTATAIALVVAVAGIGASRFHALPNLVLGCRLALRALAVCFVRPALAMFTTQTAAPHRFASAQIPGPDRDLSAAVAATQPKTCHAPIAANVRNSLNRNQSAEPLIGQITKALHVMSLTRVHHVTQ